MITEAKESSREVAFGDAVPEALDYAVWTFGIGGIIAAAHVVALTTLAVGGLGIALRYRKKFSPLLRGDSKS